MAKKGSSELPAIRLGSQLGPTFDELQDRIRERAYHIFLDRGSERGDPVADWLDAQMELVIDPIKARKIRDANPPGEDDVCTMCGKYCAIKTVREYFKE